MTETGDDGDGTSILQKLAAQSGTEINDIDPETGAIRRRRPKGSSLKEAKTAQNLEGDKKPFQLKANCPLSNRCMPPYHAGSPLLLPTTWNYSNLFTWGHHPCEQADSMTENITFL